MGLKGQKEGRTDDDNSLRTERLCNGRREKSDGSRAKDSDDLARPDIGERAD